MSNVRWIESGGGPLVMIDESLTDLWNGSDGDDYDEACEIDHYAGKLTKPWGEVIVLGDEPLRTAVIRVGTETRIVRWMYAPSDEQALALASGPLPAPSEAVERLALSLEHRSLVLFDSAEPGASAEDRLVVEPPTCAALATYVLKKEDTGLVVHRFE